MNHCPLLHQKPSFRFVDIAHMYRPTMYQQVGSHRATHVANTDNANGISKLGQDCTNRFDLLTDIKMPIAMPSVTIAVPP